MKKHIVKILHNCFFIALISLNVSNDLKAQTNFYISPIGAVQLCPATSVTLHADPLPPGYTYQWMREEYGAAGCNFWVANIPGATSQDYTASQSSVYWCAKIDSNGIDAGWSEKSAWVTVLGEPVHICYYSSPLNFCQPDSVVLWVNNLWLGPSGPGTTGVQWQLNGVDIPSANTSYYSAKISGTYRCRVHNSCGSQYSSSVVVTANPRPSASITTNGPTTFCSGGSVVLNAVVAANRTYQWKKNGVDISGAALASYTATIGATYKVTVTNTVTGCSKTSAAGTKVIVNAKPAATLTPQGPTTFCAGGSVVLAANTGTGLTYKWKKNNNFISGAALSNYTATTQGTYRVEVTNSNGCSKLSPVVTVTVPCREGKNISQENNFDFSVYPNPNSGEFTIKFSNELSSVVQIEMTDELGKVVRRFETDDETIVIKKSNLAKGIYCLTARNKNEVVKKKISVVK